MMILAAILLASVHICDSGQCAYICDQTTATYNAQTREFRIECPGFYLLRSGFED